jgi:YhcH/YjgK/YiaL family protein
LIPLLLNATKRGVAPLIFDQCVSLRRYAELGPNFETAVKFLSGRTLDSFAPGKLAIDGVNVYASVREADLAGRPERWESHRRYADIQILLDGSEAILFTPNAAPEPSATYDEARDIEFYEGVQGVRCPLKPGDFMIFLPGELHAPDRPEGETTRSKKLVVKVLVEG